MFPFGLKISAWSLLSVTAIITFFPVGFSARAITDRRVDSFNDTLSWGPCTSYPAPYQCSKFRVPLDYAHTSNGSLVLALIRLPASTTPRKGYMFYNPGGPGGSGVDYVGTQGLAIQGRLGSGWDILSWDPRGVGESEPDLTLFDTADEYDAFYNQLQGQGKYEAHGNTTLHSDADFFRSKAPDFDSLLQQFDEKYLAKSGDKLKYIGSAATVRDLVGMVDAIYGPGVDVNFYGISYGTILSAYLIEMFPHRVGKVIADGVLDAITWTNGPLMNGFPADQRDTEAVLRGWSSACASSSHCTLSQLGHGTAEGVLGIIDSVLNTAYKTYDGTVWSRLGFFLNGTVPSDIHAFSYGFCSLLLLDLLSSSQNWHALDELTATLYNEQNNISVTPTITSRSELGRTLPLLRGIPPSWSVLGQWGKPSDAWSQAVYAIACGDSQDTPLNYTTSTVFDIAIHTSRNVSSHFGTVMSPKWYCHRWTTRAVERLSGEFDTQPKNVVLVIGNTLDPATPYASAKSMASKKRLGNKARLVQFNAIGHYTGSNSSPFMLQDYRLYSRFLDSTCIDNVVGSYVNGNVPVDKGNDGPDVICEVDSTPFST